MGRGLPGRAARATLVAAMSLPLEALKLAASLLAILALAWTARRLGLGAAPRLRDESSARAAIEAALPGFVPAVLALDSEGRGALARDADGRVLLLRAHGAHFVARLLPPGASAIVDGGDLVVDPGERRFGRARLTLADPSLWTDAIRAPQGRAHA